MNAWRVWHAAILGSAVVAYLSADEATYRIHQFSGYLFVGLVVLRLAAAVATYPQPGAFALRLPAGAGSVPLSFQRGSLYRAVRPWMVLVLIVTAVAAGLTGVVADWTGSWSEKLHEAVGEMTPWIAFGHIALVIVLLAHPGRGRKTGTGKSVTAAALALCLTVGAAGAAVAGSAQDAPMQELGRRALAEDATFTGFDPARGRDLFLRNNSHDPAVPACSACHTADVRQTGAHAKTGRTIAPLAPSVNRDRLTDIGTLDKRFGRDCKAVFGRACTAREQGDIAAFLGAQ